MPVCWGANASMSTVVFSIRFLIWMNTVCWSCPITRYVLLTAYTTPVSQWHSPISQWTQSLQFLSIQVLCDDGSQIPFSSILDLHCMDARAHHKKCCSEAKYSVRCSAAVSIDPVDTIELNVKSWILRLRTWLKEWVLEKRCTWLL